MGRQSIEIQNKNTDDYGYNEALKTLRTNLQFCGSNIHTIMFTSSVPDEGKSDIAFSTASALAQIGKKVLLVDADIRKSVLATRFQLKQKVDGLSQYLSGQKALTDVVYDTNYENLSMVLAGPYAPNPAELLEEELFAELLAYGRENYDYVIVDTPPIGSVIDGAIVARKCDGVVLVIESGAISYRLEQRVKEQLERSGCRILGVVLNKVETSPGSYYRKYGKYKKYGKYQKYGRYDGYYRASEYGHYEADDIKERDSSYSRLKTGK